MCFCEPHTHPNTHTETGNGLFAEETLLSSWEGAGENRRMSRRTSEHNLSSFRSADSVGWSRKNRNTKRFVKLVSAAEQPLMFRLHASESFVTNESKFCQNFWILCWSAGLFLCTFSSCASVLDFTSIPAGALHADWRYQQTACVVFECWCLNHHVCEIKICWLVTCDDF